MMCAPGSGHLRDPGRDSSVVATTTVAPSLAIRCEPGQPIVVKLVSAFADPIHQIQVYVNGHEWSARKLGPARHPVHQAGQRLQPSVDGNLPEKVEVVQHLPRTQHHGGQGVIGHGNGQANLFPEPLVQVL